MATASHYHRLGVTPASSPEEIRAAYRALANRLHPDRLIDASGPERALAERRMREINESWHVLRDPARRRAYDDSQRTATGSRTRPAQPSTRSTVVRSEVDDDLVDVLPPMTGLTAGLFRHLPWVVLVVVFGLIFVVSAYAGGDTPTADPSTADQAEVGSCIDVGTGTATTIVSCEGDHDFRIVAAVARPADCPAGSEGRRFAADGHFDCLVAG